ncbi:ABC transporter ATP-binding protein [Bdellovibrio sp. SKB1291214]|uniref:ABC transporter ATP-binding protein n=1 Tax=Bdellovibrio sp. SKB1291214 TaxID=1732569 RepID=UPI000B517DD7|nr:ABC transporter ATP-binding protein [Bdellovibrio sp. SKB1291214]UYL08157.1 ABC transporter ATP-binding protein [Bdellovibrio sp. SKB1291214]
MPPFAGIQLNNLKKNFGTREVLQSFNLQIPAGSFLSLVGPSGCGKSTVLRLIANLEKPTSGEVQNSQANHFGFVFQEANLLPWNTVFENVSLPFQISPELKGTSKKEIKFRALEALNKVGLQESANLFPHQLSGGMKMRVSIARALVTKPQLLLMDEPFAALDEFTRYQMQVQLRELWRQEGLTVLFVTHSLSEAVFMSERVVLMKQSGGGIVLDQKLNLPQQRQDELRTSSEFNQIIKTLSEGLQR